MFDWLFGKKRVDKLEQDVAASFKGVRKDFEGVGKWIKHLNKQDKQLFDVLSELKVEITSIKDEIESLREAVSLHHMANDHEQLSKQTAVLDKQTVVYPVQDSVQTPVQTGNIYGILQGLSTNERVLVYTLMNSDLKLSYEDLARLLGKERSTVRGQINAIKQKNRELIQEVMEGNGKKRLFVSDDIRQKLAKYAKVRANEKKKYKKLPRSDD